MNVFVSTSSRKNTNHHHHHHHCEAQASSGTLRGNTTVVLVTPLRLFSPLLRGEKRYEPLLPGDEEDEISIQPTFYFLPMFAFVQSAGMVTEGCTAKVKIPVEEDPTVTTVQPMVTTVSPLTLLQPAAERGITSGLPVAAKKQAHQTSIQPVAVEGRGGQGCCPQQPSSPSFHPKG